MLFLTLADNGVFSSASEPATIKRNADMSSPVFKKSVRLIKSKKNIQQAYALVALDYAEKVALMSTFIDADTDPKTVISEQINTITSQRGLKIKHLNIGEPQISGEGVLWFSVSVSFSAHSDTGTLDTLLTLADHQQGFTWKSFTLSAITDKKEMELSGELAVVIIKAVE